jgi:hypothetical protein
MFSSKANFVWMARLASASIVVRRLLRCLLAGLVFLLPKLAFGQTPTLVQHVSGSNSRVGSFSSPYCYYQILPNPTTAGNAVIVGVTYGENLGNPSTFTVTDDQGDSYTTEKNFQGSTSDQGIAIAASFNVKAGARLLSACFNTGPDYNNTGQTRTAVMASEFSNVTGFDVASAGSNSSGTSLAAGSTTPTVNGDLVYQIGYNILNTYTWSAGSQSNITWNLLSADLKDGLAAQYGVYSSVGALNPTMSMGTGGAFVTAAAFFKAGAAGSVPTGMRIVHLEHISICGTSTCGSSFPVPIPLQFPSTGNLIVLNTGGGNPTCTVTSVSSTPSNTWLQAGTPQTSVKNVSQQYYAANATTSPSMSVSVTTSNGNCDWTIQFYDVMGAATSPYDTEAGGAGDQTSMTNGTLTMNYSITPSEAGEMIFTNSIWDFNTATGLTCSVGTCYVDINQYSGELLDGPESVDQNNGWGHAISTSTSPITFTWHFANATTRAVANWASTAAAFKPGSTGSAPAPPTQLRATVQ